MNILDLATLSAICIGLTEVIKRAVSLPDRVVPLVSLVVGVAGALLFLSVSRDSALLGIFAGLSASGLYSGGKTVSGN